MRPDCIKLAQFTGNQKMVRLLGRGPLPPASIFAGPEGVGKKTFAISVATRLCCETNEDDLCGRCPSCLKIQSNNHPDVRIIDFEWLGGFLKTKGKKANPRVIPIDAMRELIREIQFRPYQAKLRVFIIDDAHKLNESAANSILKTLEEPPEDAHLVLVTAFPNALLPTIRSRCPQYRFGPLSREDVCAHLQRGGGDVEESELRASFSGGSIGKATALDLENALKQRDMALGVLESWLGTRRFSSIFKHTESASFRPVLGNRELTLGLLDALRTVVEDLYYLMVETPTRLVSIDRIDQIRSMASQLKLRQAQNLIYHIQQAREEVEAYVSPRMCFETLWLNSRQDPCWKS